MARIDDIGTFHDSPSCDVVEWRLGAARSAEATLDQDADGTAPQDFKGTIEVGHVENHLARIETERTEGQPTELTVSEAHRAALDLSATILDQSVADNRGRFDFTLPNDLLPENPKIED